MASTFTTVKQVLDSYVKPWEATARAYGTGNSIAGRLCVGYARYKEDNVDTQTSRLLFELYLNTISTLKLISESNRLKKFEATRWSKPFIVAEVSLLLFHSLVCCANYVEKQWGKSLLNIYKVSRPYSLLINSVTRIVFAIFEFRHRPKEALICLLAGGYTSVLYSNPWLQKTQLVNKAAFLSATSIIFYVGNRSEKALVTVYFVSYAVYKYISFRESTRTLPG